MKFNEQIKRLRCENNLTQEELAQMINISRQSVSAWERGIYYPDILTMLELADVLGVTVDYLLRGDQIMSKKINRQLKRGKWLNLVFLGVTIVFLGLTILTLTQRSFFAYGHAYITWFYLFVLVADVISVFYAMLLWFSKGKYSGVTIVSLALTLILIVIITVW